MSEIHGIQIKVPGAELARKLEDRAEEWRGRAAEIERELVPLREDPSDVEIEHQLHQGLSIGVDSPQRDLIRKELLEQRAEQLAQGRALLRNIEQRVTFCAWMAKHVVKDVDYVLTREDLDELAPPLPAAFHALGHISRSRIKTIGPGAVPLHLW